MPNRQQTSPSFYDESRVGTIYAPRFDAVLKSAEEAIESGFVAEDGDNVLTLIDAQIDFVHQTGALSVPGAVEDVRRTIKWMLNNLHKINKVVITLDTHIPHQIFFPSWWQSKDGSFVSPFRQVVAESNGDDVEVFHLRKMSQAFSVPTVRPRFSPEWSAQYVERLEAEARKRLMVWPFHTMLGTIGHAVDPALYEVVMFWSILHQKNPDFVTKGTSPFTEHYSPFEAEIPHPQMPQTGLNVELLNDLRTCSTLTVAGQAKSHCVLEAVRSIISFGKAGALEILPKLRIMVDAMSDVTGFDSDEEYRRWEREIGVQLVNSQDNL